MDGSMLSMKRSISWLEKASGKKGNPHPSPSVNCCRLGCLATAEIVSGHSKRQLAK